MARAEEAARLRAVGRTWQEIGDHLGFRSRSGAQMAVQRHYAREVHDPATSRRSAVDGLRRVTAVLFERMADAKASGNTQAIVALSREIRSTTDQLAKLDGLHAAQRVDVKVEQTGGGEVVADLRRELFARYEQRLALESAAGTRPVIDAEVVEIEPRRRRES